MSRAPGSVGKALEMLSLRPASARAPAPLHAEPTGWAACRRLVSRKKRAVIALERDTEQIKRGHRRI